MGENQCYHCGAITPCDHGLSGSDYVAMQAAYWTAKNEELNKIVQPSGD